MQPQESTPCGFLFGMLIGNDWGYKILRYASLNDFIIDCDSSYYCTGSFQCQRQPKMDQSITTDYMLTYGS